MTETGLTPSASQAGASPPSEERVDRAKLDRSLKHGVAWMGSVRWLTQLITWGSTIVVARLLSPADYGLVGMATVYLGVVTLLSEFGIGTTVVTLRDLTESEIAQINGLSLLFSIASFIVSCAAAPVLAWYFESPELTPVVIVMASIFLVTWARVVPQALLQREMRFRDLALNDAVQALTVAAASITCAALGLRYWTLVVSAVLGALLSTVLIVRLRRVAVVWPKWKALGPAVTFSGHTIMSRLTWYVYQNADFFIAAKVLGKGASGAYRYGWDMALAPVEKITAMVGRVTPAVFSASQRDFASLRRYLLKITQALSLAAFPASIGLALVARDVMLIALGTKWESMIAPMQILSVSAALRAIAPVLPQIMTAIGENRRVMHFNVVACVVMPLAFLLGSRWGIVGIAAMWVAVHPLVVMLPTAVVTFRRIELPWREYARAVWPALSATLVMCAAVLAARLAYPADLPRVARLAVDVAIGAAAYAGALLAMHQPVVRGYLAHLRGANA